MDQLRQAAPADLILVHSLSAIQDNFSFDVLWFEDSHEGIADDTLPSTTAPSDNDSVTSLEGNVDVVEDVIFEFDTEVSELYTLNLKVLRKLLYQAAILVILVDFIKDSSSKSCQL